MLSSALLSVPASVWQSEGLIGIFTGAAAGAVAGNTVGKLIDENVMRMYQCDDCNYQWRAA